MLERDGASAHGQLALARADQGVGGDKQRRGAGHRVGQPRRQRRQHRVATRAQPVAVHRVRGLAARVDGHEGQLRGHLGHELEQRHVDAGTGQRGAQPRPQASSPAPPASATGAPARAATMATLATTPAGPGHEARRLR